MAVRKSAKIGMTFGEFLILDSKHINNDTRYLVRCLKCGAEQWKCRHSIEREITECDKCGHGRKNCNANGHYGEPIYKRYIQIKRRLKHNAHYIGVKMCKAWRENFMEFYKWAMKSGFSPELTIDRIDNKKGYSPSNCRWVDLKAQANNKRSNVIVEYNNERLTLAQFSDKYAEPRGISRSLVYQRYKRGKTLDEIINMPVAINKWSKKRKEKQAG